MAATPNQHDDHFSLLDYSILKADCLGMEYVVRPHIVEMCETIELCMHGLLPDGKKNLIINIPPRFSKTTTVQNMAEYATGHLPDCEYIFTGYAKGLAEKSTVAIRNNMMAEWYMELFPACRVDKKKATRRDEFETTEGGVIYAVGLDGSVTGYGAGKTRPGFGGALIIDDPIKVSDAHSETMRENAITAYKETLRTRTNSNDTPIIVIMQRVHPHDLCGYLLTEEKDDWHQLIIPAMDEDTGEPLWPQRITKEQLMKMKEVDPFTFYTQYQQRPIQPGGTVIKEEWWNFYTDREEVIKRCSFIAIFADTAYKETDAADYTVLQVWGFEGGRNAYLLEQVREKMEFPELLKATEILWKKWTTNEELVRYGRTAKQLFIEDKASGQSLIQSLELKIGAGNVTAWEPKEFDAPDDKVSKAKEMSWLVYGGCVWLPDPDEIKGCDWVDDQFLREWAEFRVDMGHKHDDQVDASTMATLTWRSMGGGHHVYQPAVEGHDGQKRD